MPERTLAVRIADVNVDGKLDLIVLSSSEAEVYLGDGAGAFARSAVLQANADPSTLACGDLDEDGLPDLVIANRLDLSLFHGRGDGSFERTGAVIAGQGPTDLALGDVNGDLHLDLVVTNEQSEDASALLGRGDGTFAPEFRFDALTRPYRTFGLPDQKLLLVDMNGDQIPDPVVGGLSQALPSITSVENLLLGVPDPRRQR